MKRRRTLDLEAIHARVLQGTLAARVVWNGWFALLLVEHQHASLTEIFGLFLKFTFVDALLATTIAAAYLIAAPRQMLWLSPTVDGVTRLALVGLLHLAPGISDVPITVILFVGLIATFAMVDGLLDTVEGTIIRRAYGEGTGGLSLMMSGLVAALTGAVMFTADVRNEELAILLAVLSGAHAVGHFWAMQRSRRLLAAIRGLRAPVRASAY